MYDRRHRNRQNQTGSLLNKFHYTLIALCNERLQGSKIKLQVVYNRRKYIGLKESDIDCVSLGHNVSDKTKVNAVLAQENNTGAAMAKSTQVTFWGGYAGLLYLTLKLSGAKRRTLPLS